ncbi:adenylyltransferase/cytidyltransferase family protein [Patescibacteria group bacterium]|nr:adenylyltransferase/cytidyltransferase family protein [Patescibacteria group bacterium]
MAEVVSINKIGSVCSKFKKQGKVVVLAGGCFDLLHPGHVIFLEKAKKAGDILIVLLESDVKVKAIKGINRPVYNQAERVVILSALQSVDYVIKLPYFKKDLEYDRLILKIKPDIIAATEKDRNTYFLQRATQLVGAKLKFVTKTIGNYSTSSLISSITVQ